MNRTERIIFDFLEKYIRNNGWAPNYREIMKATGIGSTQTVNKHLLRLHEQGHIVKGKGSRMIRIKKEDPKGKLRRLL